MEERPHKEGTVDDVSINPGTRTVSSHQNLGELISLSHPVALLCNPSKLTHLGKIFCSLTFVLCKLSLDY